MSPTWLPCPLCPSSSALFHSPPSLVLHVVYAHHQCLDDRERAAATIAVMGDSAEVRELVVEGAKARDEVMKKDINENANVYGQEERENGAEMWLENQF